MLNQYKVTMEHDDPEFTLKALATVPSLIFDQPQLLLRSTNSVRLFFIDHAEAWNYKDFMFLIIFPMSQFVSLGLVYFSYYWIKKNKNKIPKVHSKYFLSFWIIFSISLNIIILKLMPLKLTEEINTRKK